jgi:hypothetical protein
MYAVDAKSPTPGTSVLMENQNAALAAPVFAGRQLLAYDSALVTLTRHVLDGCNDGEVIDIHPEMMGLRLRIDGRHVRPLWTRFASAHMRLWLARSPIYWLTQALRRGAKEREATRT